MIVGISRNTFECLELLETGWRMEFDFHNFVKILSKVRVVVGVRVSALALCNMISIYRVRNECKESEKRYGIQCEINSFQIKSNFGENLIFSSICKLARNWQVLWAILDLKFDKNPILLKIYLVFIFFII